MWSESAGWGGVEWWRSSVLCQSPGQQQQHSLYLIRRARARWGQDQQRQQRTVDQLGSCECPGAELRSVLAVVHGWISWEAGSCRCPRAAVFGWWPDVDAWRKAPRQWQGGTSRDDHQAEGTSQTWGEKRKSKQERRRGERERQRERERWENTAQSWEGGERRGRALLPSHHLVPAWWGCMGGDRGETEKRETREKRKTETERNMKPAGDHDQRRLQTWQDSKKLIHSWEWSADGRDKLIQASWWASDQRGHHTHQETAETSWSRWVNESVIRGSAKPDNKLQRRADPGQQNKPMTRGDARHTSRWQRQADPGGGGEPLTRGCSRRTRRQWRRAAPEWASQWPEGVPNAPADGRDKPIQVSGWTSDKKGHQTHQRTAEANWAGQVEVPRWAIRASWPPGQGAEWETLRHQGSDWEQGGI